ncbi:NBS-containing resistance-like protein, partial [Trifolium medium]|nr:NBS-containing resistance-like protein [Trifolium medium]
MINHTTWLISKMDPIKYIFEKPALTGRIARWQMLLSEYDIEYRTQKAIKGSVLADHLAHQPVEDYQPVKFDFPDEEIMLQFDCTNNIAEYEACIMGIEEAIDLRIKILDIYGDSALVINQVKGEWETRHPGLIPYKDYARRLLTFFNKVELHHIPREENQMADALATLSSMFE